MRAPEVTPCEETFNAHPFKTVPKVQLVLGGFWRWYSDAITLSHGFLKLLNRV